MNYGKKIAEEGLKIKAIKLNPDKPFQWASGFQMPIYNDNRMFLFNSKHRQLIAEGLESIADKLSFDIIAGTSTAGISPATSLANEYGSPLIYIRDKPKEYGLKNQIEGIDAEVGLERREVLLIEDLISTGGSSVNAVQAIRDANGQCYNCISIFNYGFETPKKMFEGKIPYDEEKNLKLNSHCAVDSVLTYDTLLDVAKATGYINSNQIKMLEEWREDPFGWGEKNGFPRVQK